jgi:hypothetical protein
MTYRLVREPLVSDDHLRVSFEAGLDPTRFPIPENDTAIRLSATDPFAIRGEANLTGITSYGVSLEYLFAVLPEVIRTIYQDLVVK